MAVENTAAAIVIVRYMKMRYANNAALDLIGCRDFSVCSKNILDFVHAEFVEMVRSRIETMIRQRGIPQRFQIKLRKITGQEIWVDTNIKPVRVNSSSYHFVVTAFDISELKRVEQALRTSEEKYRFLIDHSENPIVHYDKNNRVILTNKIAAMRLGEEQKNLIGRSIESIYPHDLAEIYKQRNSIVMESGNGFMVEDRIDVDGSIRFYLSSIEPVRGPDGSITAVQVISYDITRQKRNEEELKSLNEKLERRVQHETKLRLDQQHMLLQQSKMAAMGEMIGAIAHQWRQPLNALALIIQGFTERVMSGETITPEEVHRMEVRTMKQITHMSDTIDDFRNFFRPAREPVDFNALGAVRHVITLMLPQLRNNNIDLKVKMGNEQEHLFAVRGFPNEFQHALMNIISNSRDAILMQGTRDNPVAGTISISLSRDEEWVEVLIEDDGPGVPSDIIKNVFDPFFTTKTKGTGIGLYMCKMIIENSMKGRITMQNLEHSHGASVRILIPAMN